MLVVALVGRGACSSDGPATPGSDPVELAQAAAGGSETGPSALDDPRDRRLPAPLIKPGELLTGGPSPDGIPAIESPRFQRARDVDWLAATDPVLALTVAGETRAYPIQILTWHEIVNDTVGSVAGQVGGSVGGSVGGGVPVAVTYCPLCNSGLAFDRRAAGRVLTFGTSGKLYASNLVMYDRQTESLWPQLTGQAALGVLTGSTLASFPLAPVAWPRCSASWPRGSRW
ncbi:MAG: DUF3179 domain-containing (seleno)protein [Kribbellaceae bacterium]